jgi:tetratricopeptide (TPR) repeat protein
MAGRKKVIRKKLKEPDEFISFTEQAFLFVTQHYKKIVLGGIILLTVVLSIFLFEKWEEKREGEAYQKFRFALEIYQMTGSSYREDSPEEYRKALEGFDEVISKFSRTSSGKLSMLYKGNLHFRLGEFDEAIKAYEAFLSKAGQEKLYRSFALEGLGYAYGGKKDYEKALDAYQKIVTIGDHFQMADAYFNIGRCYEKLGKKKEALENYKSFLKASKTSVMTNVILEKVSQLEN